MLALKAVHEAPPPGTAAVPSTPPATLLPGGARIAATETGAEIASLLLRAGVLNENQVKRVRRVQEKLPGRAFLSVARELGYASDEQARKALRENRLSVGVGALLVELGYIRSSELEAALEIQRNATQRKKLGDVLVEQRFIDEQRFIEVLAIQLGFTRLSPDYASLDRERLKKININWCVQNLVVPLRNEGGKALVAMADPLDRNAREWAESAFGPGIEIGIAGRREILDALGTLESGGKRAAIETVVAESAVVDLVNTIVLDALREGASDIHIEPLKNRIRVRFRRDGVMTLYKDFDSGIAATLTSRVKIMAGTDISEKRRHQDGRIRFEDPLSGQSCDLRVSVYTTLNGQKIVMRLLNRRATRIDIRESGLGTRILDRFLEEVLDVPSGVILITGPTGSGKTTTLYGAVNYLNNDETCIVTAEDPVEYIVDGIAQCTINPQINVTFEETLRAMVRQDPDVIVLGEIRDRISAEAAIQAALTGHKVLTTFHTEDTIGGLLRLMNMDIETFLISSTVVSVLAQRLLRRVCPHCALAYKPTPSDLRRLSYTAADVGGSEFRMGKGCAQCRYSGYEGRVGVFELLVLNEDVKIAMRAARSSSEIRRISMETSGLVTLLEDGIAKAAAGFTSIAEVLKNLPRIDKPRPVAEIRRIIGI